MGPESFRPPLLLQNPHLQSILASSRLRGDWMRRRRWLPAAEHLLDCGAGVRLQGFYTAPENPATCRGLVVLLHGWEGSVESTYLVGLAAHLRSRGYELFRLNFRDHGDTHHLNEELFHSCRLDEAVGGVAAIRDLFPARPMYLVGFSLGGNFALRIASRATDAGLSLEHVVAVCPVIDPARGLESMESKRMYERRFMVKWRRSLRRKQEVFPRRYDFTEWMKLNSLREQTRYLVERESEYGSLEEYLRGYSVAGPRLSGLRVQATIVTAADDPIIPVSDFRALERPPCLRLEILARGGHCGFIESLTLDSWIDRRVAAILAAARTAQTAQS